MRKQSRRIKHPLVVTMIGIISIIVAFQFGLLKFTPVLFKRSPSRTLSAT